MPTSEFFTQNRRRLYAQLQPDSLLLLSASTQSQRNTDCAFPFEQESNFWYLTGIDYPNWQLLVDVDAGQEWLIAPEVEHVIEVFDGNLPYQDAVHQSGVAQVLNSLAGQAKLKELLGRKEQAYALKPMPSQIHGVATNPAQQRLWRQLAGIQRQDIRRTLSRQRAIKQPLELSAMQRAIDITINGIRAMLADARTYQHEYEVEARLDYEFRRRGAKIGFDSIAAAGKNTCTIHHMANNTQINQDDWLLFDVGAQVSRYTADIARTVPLGLVTDRQAAVYQALIRVHERTAALLRAGQNIRSFLAETDAAMMHELVELKLIQPGDTQAYRRYFPHAIGHGLGLDPHDALGQPDVFAEHMVMTVEPGIYIPEEGIGMRIESVVHITANGPLLMSSALPVELAELQSLVA